MNNLSTLNDQNLYQLCKTYGAHALEWRRKFIGLLPEVFRRKLYEKKGFESIFVFAKKLAGLSEKKVRILSQGAVETLVRDEKFAEKMSSGMSDLFGNIGGGECFKNKNGLFEPEIESKSVRAHTFGQLVLSPEVQQKLFELQQKGFDINQLILDLLKKREKEIAQKKEEIAEKVLQKEEESGKVPLSAEKLRHHIPVAVRKILHEEHGTKCSIKNCQKSATTIHHTQRFSLSGSHNPHCLAPLCKDHHELAHAIDVRYREIKGRGVAMV